MTKEEKMAFEFGKSFSTVDGQIACCYDSRMNKLVGEARKGSGSKRNLRNMMAWWNGLADANPDITIPNWITEKEK
jgi:hypothetical protein